MGICGVRTDQRQLETPPTIDFMSSHHPIMRARLVNLWGCCVSNAFCSFDPSVSFNDYSRSSGASD
jgi:hypothetical protein